MPGQKSLDEQQYYAHPRNTFWDIIESLFLINRSDAYEQRLKLLLKKNIGLWDVIQHCKRVGSLDSKIENSSVIINDFNTLLVNCTDLTTIVFNGSKAEQLFKKHVQPTLTDPSIQLIKLVSTSPAMAMKRYDEKLAEWRVIKQCLSNSG